MAIGVASSLFPATMRYDVATFFRRRHLYVNEALYIKKNHSSLSSYLFLFIYKHFYPSCVVSASKSMRY